VKKPEDWAWGLHSFEAALECHPEIFLEIQVEEEAAADVRARVESLAKAQGLRLKTVRRLPGFLAEKRTQGVAFKIQNFPQERYADFEEEFLAALREPAAHSRQWAVLDSLQDPRNYGAILRSAAAFGIEAVITGTRDQCPLTGVVAQASAGNAFRLRNVEAPNLSRVLERVQTEAGNIWALEAGGRGLPQLLGSGEPRPIVWIVGSEGEGIRSGLLKYVTEKVSIPMEPGVESLNASVAASLAFYGVYSQRGR
jgi:23S rRNA (guanosine2251-2'-O)-methyltransferase